MRLTAGFEMLGRLKHRALVLRSVSAACKRATSRVDEPESNDFRAQVVSAVSEAFNNIVLHSYAGRDDGVVEMDIQTLPDHISIEFRDWGDSFDPDSVPPPNFDQLPESGLGVYIMKTLMELRYAPGQPNVLTLSKKIPPGYRRSTPAKGRRRVKTRSRRSKSAT